MPTAPSPLQLDEVTARQLTLLRACESGATPHSLWSPQDAAWATRLASTTAQPAGASAGAVADARTSASALGQRQIMPSVEAARPERFLAERARHAMERLLPRDRRLAPLLQGRAWLSWGVPAALAVGLVLGVLAHSLDATQRINLLALPLWGVVLWNLVVYLLIASEPLGRVGNKAGVRRPAPLRGLLTRWMGGASGGISADPAQRFRQEWAALATPVAWARAAVLLHTAAAALGLGLIAGLYLRGLLWDYRAGWQSTFLDAPAVHVLLNQLLWPAQWVTGLRVPDAAAMAALRIQPGVPETSALASGALWIHLLAASVALWVVLPRTLLALWAAAQSAARARRVPVPVHEPYYQRLILQGGGAAVRVQVLPHGADLPAAAALGVNALAQAVWGESARLTVASTVRYGHEEEGARAAVADSSTTLRLVCVDLASTPEAEAHGCLLAALQAAGQRVVVVADETAWRQRFGAGPERLAARQALWQAMAAAHGAGFASVELAGALAEPEPGRAALEAVLNAT
jgi:Protein of unknown function (DUF2868)